MKVYVAGATGVPGTAVNPRHRDPRVVADGDRGRMVMSITFPGESAEYRAARDGLLEREVRLRGRNRETGRR